MAAAKPLRDTNSRLRSILTQLRKHVDSGSSDQLEIFTRQYYRAVSHDDLSNQKPGDLAGAALAHWKFAQKRAPGKALIRVYNPDSKKDGWQSSHTIVEMVNDDMPFLVDTMGMILNKHGYSLHLTIHPIIKVQRDTRGVLQKVLTKEESAQQKGLNESFMQVQIDRETNKTKLAELERDIKRVMEDNRAVVKDWREMRAKASEIHDGLISSKLPLSKSEIKEGQAFIQWLVNNHFTFLGYREYKLVRSKSQDVLKVIPDSGLGLLRDSRTPGSAKSQVVLPEDVRPRAREKELLIITKTNSVSTVHRPGYMDYIGIKYFNDKGDVIGEQRFLGLFTSSAYSRSPLDIPLLRHKTTQVMARSGLPPDSHGGKALQHILETFPRDELFQISSDELFENVTGVLQLQERQRIKLFIRRDAFGRFFSCLAYVPRDRFSTRVRKKIEALLRVELDGNSAESHAFLSESTLARIHIVIRTRPWVLPEYDIPALEEKIRNIVRSWEDQLHDALIDHCGEEKGLFLLERFGESLPAAYSEDVKPKAAVYDLEQMDGLLDENTLHMSLYRPQHNPKGLWRFKVFHKEQPLPISDALPMLENLGVKVISERPYEVNLEDGTIIWIQDFEMIYSQPEDRAVEPLEVRGIVQDTFARVWNGEAENDGFNKLVLAAQLTWRQVVLLRAYCKYLLQTGMPFSQAYIENALITNADLARSLVSLFATRFDPALKDRDEKTRLLKADIKESLENVTSLDDDRILSGYLNLISATLRTNFYQTDSNKQLKDYISFKFDPSRIPELPLPRPAYEIFVYSPRVEGVHLRGGKVARGGLRWSDRREDFRTEVLGLMKAQQVKNAVIIPVGAKGGFYVKRPPASGEREAVLREGQACYRTFIRGLLDITDNFKANRVIPPKQLVRHDEDDTYLVVAADKGTATFSDIANGVAAEYGFWLDDAFASGGSVGYDHKKMGITAKGAWESVKRHFREMGVNCQTTNFSAVGVGDMSGDVFGNGMLLSRHIKLKAAFDHRHIFIDPFPDPETSYVERERLFKLPRSSWEDYNSKLISKGGGVYSRSAKNIKLSAEAREALGIDDAALTPQQLMRAILKAPVDLFWNGGIGTYVKSSRENNSEVGDRSNDGLRISANELRCRVIGEGGNLGLTQLGRIEFALQGGHINTDFIDNAAGVDCSDHEVNIKILLNLASKQRLANKQRNKLLSSMTDEVSDLVLRDNYMQAQALSLIEAQAGQRLNEHAYLVRTLERDAGLNRALEFLPNDEEVAERRADGKGLTRPELSVVLSYSKIDIYKALLESDVPEDTYLKLELTQYFPEPLQDRFKDLMPKHRLRREIIATAITNSMVNRMGATFATRMVEETGVDTASVARAYTIAREALDMRETWGNIEALDNQIPASVQIAMMVQTGRMLRHITRLLLNNPDQDLNIAKTVAAYGPGVTQLQHHLANVLGPVEAMHYGETVQQYMDIGVPEELAKRVAAVKAMYSSLDIIDVAREYKLNVDRAAAIYFQLEARLDLTWLREQIEKLEVEGHWQAIARGTLRDNLYAQQRRLTDAVLESRPSSKLNAEAVVNQWLDERDQRVQHTLRVLSDMHTAGTIDFATASVAIQEISKLA